MPERPIHCLKECAKRNRGTPLIGRRFYSAYAANADDLGPVVQDEHQSFRVLRDGKKLPLPPVLDPVVLSERSRWERPKEKPNVSKFTPFQKKLWENPYAHILASSVRTCRATSSLLPSALLLSLHPRPHPSTRSPWLLPVSLTTEAHHLGNPYRVLSNKFFVHYLGTKKNWRKGLHGRFPEQLGRKVIEDMVWREDMSDLILALLRKRVADKLKWNFSRTGRLLPCHSPASDHISAFENVSCVLYIPSLRTHADELQNEAANIADEVDKRVDYYLKQFPKQLDPHKRKGASHPSSKWRSEPLVPRLLPRLRFSPLEFKTTEWRRKRVAVYSLYDLLGEEHLQDVIQGSKYEGERCLVLKSGRHNVPVEMLLMQLQAYLAEPGP